MSGGLHRDTIEGIIGDVTGSIDRPEVVVCGRYRGSDLEIVGRTVPFNPAQADAARQGDHYRHPLRFHRVRGDLTPNDVDRLPA